jgi:hypothetical protein
MHGHVARAFVHDLHAFGPRARGEFALHFEFAEFRFVVGVGNRAGTQAVADGSSSDRLFHHLAVPPDDDREFEGAILGFDVACGAAQRSFCARDERWSFCCLKRVPILLHTPIIFRTVSISCWEEMASRFAGRPRLSQTAQRVARGRQSSSRLAKVVLPAPLQLAMT